MSDSNFTNSLTTSTSSTKLYTNLYTTSTSPSTKLNTDLINNLFNADTHNISAVGQISNTITDDKIPIKFDWCDMTPNSITYKNSPLTNHFNLYTLNQEKVFLPLIKKVEILKPNKVMRFTFTDKTVIKTICLDEDNFNFEFSFYLAYSKYIYRKFLTPNGIEKKAIELMDNKEINKLVNKNIKAYLKEEKQKEKEEAEKKAKEKARKNKIAKKIARKEKAKENRINEIAEAIKRAK